MILLLNEMIFAGLVNDDVALKDACECIMSYVWPDPLALVAAST